jgi:hypothetical protein
MSHPRLVVEWIMLWSALGMYELAEPTGVNPAELACLSFADCFGLVPPDHVPSVELRMLAVAWDVPWQSAVRRRGALAVTVARLYWAISKEMDK